MPAAAKAQRVLHAKMGLESADMPLEQARQEFMKSFNFVLPDSAIQALVALFRLNIPSISAVYRGGC